MYCPTCGLANPATALKCDCGYDFPTSQPSDTPGWPVETTWNQRLAAFWSVFWPSILATLVVVGLVTSGFPVTALEGHLSAVSVTTIVIYFCLQTLSTFRLVRKKYRSFRVFALGVDGNKHSLSLLEAGLVSL